MSRRLKKSEKDQYQVPVTLGFAGLCSNEIMFSSTIPLICVDKRSTFHLQGREMYWKLGTVTACVGKFLMNQSKERGTIIMLSNSQNSLKTKMEPGFITYKITRTNLYYSTYIVYWSINLSQDNILWPKRL